MKLSLLVELRKLTDGSLVQKKVMIMTFAGPMPLAILPVRRIKIPAVDQYFLITFLIRIKNPTTQPFLKNHSTLNTNRGQLGPGTETNSATVRFLSGCVF